MIYHLLTEINHQHKKEEKREIIYKHLKNYLSLNITHLAMVIRQPTAEWKEIHKELLTLPFCHIRQQPVRIMLFFPIIKSFNKLHPYEGCCDVCVKYRRTHIRLRIDLH